MVYCNASGSAHVTRQVPPVAVERATSEMNGVGVWFVIPMSYTAGKQKYMQVHFWTLQLCGCGEERKKYSE